MTETGKGERLVLHDKPKARLVRFEEQLPLTPDAPLIERYSTARGVIFERHIIAGQRDRWYMVKP